MIQNENYLSLRIAIVIFSNADISYLIELLVRLISMLVGVNPSNNSQNSSISNANVFNTSPSKSALSVYSYSSQHYTVLREYKFILP